MLKNQTSDNSGYQIKEGKDGNTLPPDNPPCGGSAGKMENSTKKILEQFYENENDIPTNGKVLNG